MSIIETVPLVVVAILSETVILNFNMKNNYENKHKKLILKQTMAAKKASVVIGN